VNELQALTTGEYIYIACREDACPYHSVSTVPEEPSFCSGWGFVLFGRVHYLIVHKLMMN